MEEVSFNCHKCGNCCSDPNGWVYLDNENIKRLALFFNLQPFEFTAKYVKHYKGNAVLSAPAFNEPQTAIDIDYDTSHYFSEALHDFPSQQSHRHGLRLFYPHILLWIACVQL